MLKVICSIALLISLPLFIALPATAAQPTNEQLEAELEAVQPTNEQLEAELETALCINDWSGALNAIRLLIGSDTTTPEDREQLIAERRQLEDYRAARETIDRSGDAECTEAIALANSEPIAVELEKQPFDWEWEVTALGLNEFIGVASPPFSWEGDIALLGLDGVVRFESQPFDWDQETTFLGLDRFTRPARQQR